MLKYLRSIKIRQKLAFLVILFAGTAGIMVYYYLADKNAVINTNHKEKIGTEYLSHILKACQNIQKHRGAAAALLSGDKSFQERYQEFEANVDKSLKAAAETGSETPLGLAERASELRRKWENLKTANLQLTPRESNDRHSNLMAEYLNFILDIGDNSTLILDPVLDTYYLGSLALTAAPKVTEALGQMRAYGMPLVIQKQAPPEEKTRLLSLSLQAQEGTVTINRGLQKLFKNDSGLQGKLNPILTDLNSRTTVFTALANQRVISPATIEIEPKEYFDTATATIDVYFRLNDAMVEYLVGEFQKRDAQFRQERLIAVGGIAVGFLFALVLAISLALSVTSQVASLTQTFNTIGIGEFSARAEVLSEDELGVVASSLNAMLDNTLTLIQSSEERDQIQQSIMKLLDEISGVAEGDLTQEAEVTAEMTGAIADSFNFMIGELRRVISNVQEVTLNVSAAATEVQTTTEHLAEGSETQAVQIVDTSAAIEEMAASIQQVSENATLSATVSEQARANAKQGSEAVQKTIYGMNGIRQQVQETAKRIKRLGESSQEIGEIVQLISDIADRTSILALNASIQAAMAGEAGRGFAVVAGEVERLAERSAEATKRISTLIKTIQSETNEAVAAMETTTREVVVGSEVANEAGKSLVEIETVSNRLAELMQSISMATKQQARGSESVAKAMGDISEITQQTAAGTKQAAVSIRNLSELADNLRVSVSTFKLPSNGNGRY